MRFTVRIDWFHTRIVHSHWIITKSWLDNYTSQWTIDHIFFNFCQCFCAIMPINSSKTNEATWIFSK